MQFLRNFFSSMFSLLWALLSPARWFQLPRRLGQLSLPTLASWGTACVLSICVLGVYLWILRDPDELLRPWLRYLPLMLLLVFAISALVYYAVYLWFIPKYRTFEDVQTAWERGLAELAKHRLDLFDIPLFLILGSESDERVQQVLEAAGQNFAISNFPPGRAALHWYAGPDAVFLVCSELGCLTRIAQTALEQPPPPRLRVAEANSSEQGADLSRTWWPTEGADAAEAPAKEAAAESSRPEENLGQTMFVPSRELPSGLGAGGGDKPRAVKRSLALAEGVLSEQVQRLEHLCRLIAAARQPRAPVNGLVTLFPLNLILSDNSGGVDIKAAAMNDLQTLVRSLQLRAPAYAVVCGWEDDAGFRELVNRLPVDQRQKNRFGASNRPGDPPTPDRLEAVARNAIAAFEDWIYHLFKQADAINRPDDGNRRLYGLLCKVRRYLNPRLVEIVPGAYSCGEQEEATEQTALFGGCYFLAAGRDKPRQAFVRGVWAKITEQHQALEWTLAALRRDRSYRRWARVWFGLTVLLALASTFLVYRMLTNG